MSDTDLQKKEDEEDVIVEKDESKTEEPRQRPLGAFAMLYGNQQNQGGGGLGGRRGFRPMMQRRTRRSAPSTETEKVSDDSKEGDKSSEKPPEEEEMKDPEILGEGDDDDDDDTTSSSSGEESSSSDEYGESSDSEENDVVVHMVEGKDNEQEQQSKVEVEQKDESSQDQQPKERPLGSFAMLYGKQDQASGGGGRRPFRRMMMPRRRYGQQQKQDEEKKSGDDDVVDQEKKTEEGGGGSSEDKQPSQEQEQEQPSRPLGAFAMLYGKQKEGEGAEKEGEKPKNLKPFRPLMQRRRFQKKTTPIEITQHKDKKEEVKQPTVLGDDDHISSSEESDSQSEEETSSESSYGMTSDEEKEMEEMKERQKALFMSKPISVLIRASGELVDHIEEIDNLKNSKKEMAEKYKKLKEVVTELQSVNDQLMDSRNYSFDIQTNLNQSNDTIRSIGVRNRNLKVSFEKARKELDGKTEENNRLSKEIKKLKKQVKTITKKLDDQEEKKPIVDPKIVSELRDKLEKEETARQESEKANELMRKKLERGTLEAEKLKEEIKNFVSEKQKLIAFQKKQQQQLQAEVQNRRHEPKVEEEEETLIPQQPSNQQQQQKKKKKKKMIIKKKKKVMSLSDLPPFETTKQYETLMEMKVSITKLKTKELREVSSYVRPTETITTIGKRLLILYEFPPVEAERWVICRRFIQNRMKGEISKQNNPETDFAEIKGLLKIRKMRKEIDRPTIHRHSKVMGVIYDFLCAVERVCTEIRRRNKLMGIPNKSLYKKKVAPGIRRIRPSTTGLIKGPKRRLSFGVINRKKSTGAGSSGKVRYSVGSNTLGVKKYQRKRTKSGKF